MDITTTETSGESIETSWDHELELLYDADYLQKLLAINESTQAKAKALRGYNSLDGIHLVASRSSTKERKKRITGLIETLLPKSILDPEWLTDPRSITNDIDVPNIVPFEACNYLQPEGGLTITELNVLATPHTSPELAICLLHRKGQKRHYKDEVASWMRLKKVGLRRNGQNGWINDPDPKDFNFTFATRDARGDFTRYVPEEPSVSMMLNLARLRMFEGRNFRITGEPTQELNVSTGTNSNATLRIRPQWQNFIRYVDLNPSRRTNSGPIACMMYSPGFNEPIEARNLSSSRQQLRRRGQSIGPIIQRNAHKASDMLIYINHRQGAIFTGESLIPVEFSEDEQK